MGRVPIPEGWGGFPYPKDGEDSHTGTRTRVCWVKANYDNRLHYMGMGCPLQELNLYYLMCAETLRYDFHQGADSVELGGVRCSSSELQGL